MYFNLEIIMIKKAIINYICTHCFITYQIFHPFLPLVWLVGDHNQSYSAKVIYAQSCSIVLKPFHAQSDHYEVPL